jgi:hypothetical protein
VRRTTLVAQRVGAGDPRFAWLGVVVRPAVFGDHRGRAGHLAGAQRGSPDQHLRKYSGGVSIRYGLGWTEDDDYRASVTRALHNAVRSFDGRLTLKVSGDGIESPGFEARLLDGERSFAIRVLQGQALTFGTLPLLQSQIRDLGLPTLLVTRSLLVMQAALEFKHLADFPRTLTVRFNGAEDQQKLVEQINALLDDESTTD